MPVRVSSVLAVALLLLATAACGGGGDGVEAKAWARSVCGALTPWRTQIDELTVKAQAQMNAATTAAQTKTNLVTLLAGAEDASERARAGVSDAGVPDVDDGATIAQQFTGSLEKARDAYGTARRTVEGLPTDNSKQFYASVSTAFTVLKRDYEASAFDPKHVGPDELRSAFAEVPECR